MCQGCGHDSCTNQSQVAVSIALDSDAKEAKAQMAKISRQINGRNYPADAWKGKTRLGKGIPSSNSMEWELTSPDPSLAADCNTDTAADCEYSTLTNPYIRSASYFGDESGYPHTDRAKEVMRRVCTELSPIMKREGWTVHHLTEFYPFEEDLRGLNSQQGRTVLLRLRHPSNRGVFLPFTEIMWTSIHELCHNRFSDHDGDFYSLWDELNTWHGIPGGRALIFKQLNPKRQLPVNHIYLLTQGKKILLRTTELQKHFSTYADQGSSETEFIELPKKLMPSVVVRLAQLAKGLDPAVDKPLWKISNARDYWREDSDCFAICDEFHAARSNATVAVDLYLHMYLTGEKVGWQDSSKEWVLEQFGRALAWDCRFLNGPWTEPQTQTREAATIRLVEMVHVIYRATTVEEQPLRDVVVSLLKEVRKICQKEGQVLFDSSMLNQLVNQFPELGNSLQSG